MPHNVGNTRLTLGQHQYARSAGAGGGIRLPSHRGRSTHGLRCRPPLPRPQMWSGEGACGGLEGRNPVGRGGIRPSISFISFISFVSLASRLPRRLDASSYGARRTRSHKVLPTAKIRYRGIDVIDTRARGLKESERDKTVAGLASEEQSREPIKDGDRFVSAWRGRAGEIAA